MCQIGLTGKSENLSKTYVVNNRELCVPRLFEECAVQRHLS